MYAITKHDWKNTHKDYRTGDPRKGTAKKLVNCGGKGTCLVPVQVLSDDRSLFVAGFESGFRTGLATTADIGYQCADPTDYDLGFREGYAYGQHIAAS